jgi:hypothetical protein
MNFVNIHYLPGAAGNFLARIIGLNDYVVSLKGVNDPYSLTNPDEKLERYNYYKLGDRSVDNFNTDKKYSWREFEKEHSTQMPLNHLSIPELIKEGGQNVYLVRPAHPTEEVLSFSEIMGEDDIEYTIVINPGRAMDFWILNSIYKHASIPMLLTNGSRKMFDGIKHQDLLLSRDDVIEIDLATFLNEETFNEMIVKLFDTLNIPVEHRRYDHIVTLHKQWLSQSLISAKDLDKLRNELIEEGKQNR